jgi:hypothetical protein
VPGRPWRSAVAVWTAVAIAADPLGTAGGCVVVGEVVASAGHTVGIPRRTGGGKPPETRWNQASLRGNRCMTPLLSSRRRFRGRREFRGTGHPWFGAHTLNLETQSAAGPGNVVVAEACAPRRESIGLVLGAVA